MASGESGFDRLYFRGMLAGAMTSKRIKVLALDIGLIAYRVEADREYRAAGDAGAATSINDTALAQYRNPRVFHSTVPARGDQSSRLNRVIQ